MERHEAKGNVVVRMPDSLRRKAEKVAKAERRTLSQVVRIAIEEFVQKRGAA